MINLNNNKIDSLDSIRLLGELSHLNNLTLANNPVCVENYRAEIFSFLPQVDTIDGITRNGQIVKE